MTPSATIASFNPRLDPQAVEAGPILWFVGSEGTASPHAGDLSAGSDDSVRLTEEDDAVLQNAIDRWHQATPDPGRSGPLPPDGKHDAIAPALGEL